MKLTRKRFDALVKRAVERIPEELRRHLENVSIQTRDRPSPELLESMGLPPDELLLGV